MTLSDADRTRLQDLRAACEAAAAGFRARLPDLAAPLDALADRADDVLAADADERRGDEARTDGGYPLMRYEDPRADEPREGEWWRHEG